MLLDLSVIGKMVLVCLLLGINISCTSDKKSSSIITNDCSVCPLDRITSEEGGIESREDNQALDFSAEVLAQMPLIKKIVEGQVTIGGSYERSRLNSETVYWKVVHENPEITQSAGLYRVVTCALIQIVCEDTSRSDREKSNEKEKLVREFATNLDNILGGVSKNVENRDSNDQLSSKSISYSVAKKTPVASEVEVDYLANKKHSSIALLPYGNKDHVDVTNQLRAYLNGQNITTSNNLFKPSFLGQFQARIRQLEASVFSSINVNKFTNCVCYLDQATKLQEGSLAGENIITEIANVKLLLFNLKTGAVEQERFEVRGAGLTVERATGNLEEKLIPKFASLLSKFESCR